MMQAVTDALESPEVVLYMTDVTREPQPDFEFLRRHLGGRQVPVFWLLNKIDTIAAHEVLPLIASCDDADFFAEVFPLSVHRGDNVAALLERLLQRLPEGPRYFPEDMPTDRDERFLIAELIREQVLYQAREEVPHAVAVVVEMMVERADGGVEIDACLYVERDSQKRILVGKQGQMIKSIGIRARQAIGHMLHCPTHLRLLVRVNKRWKQREAALRRLGFGDT
jgi:GTP-binding protein Era